MTIQLTPPVRVVGATPCGRPGKHGGLPLRLILCSMLLLSLTACKINLNIFSDDEDDQVVSASGNFDCTNDPENSDCYQEYKPVGQCDEEDPDCTEIDTEAQFTEILVANPDDGNTFDGWGNACWVGSSFCSITITGADAETEEEGEIEATFGADVTPQDATYTYNHLGQRSSKTTVIDSVSTTIYYIYDPQGHLIGEYDESGDPLIEYIWLEGNLLAQYDYSGSATEPKMNYYVNDHLGTPVFMADRNPQQNYEITTGPFGERYGEFKTAGTTQNIRFPGQYFDEETGYSQNWNRTYDSSLGIYLQPDRLDVLSRTIDPELWMAADMGVITLPEEGEPNQLYGYANQNPVSNIDPYGLYDLAPGVPAPSGDVHKMLICVDTCTGGQVLVTATTNGHTSGSHARGTGADFIPPGGAGGSDKGTCCALKCHAVYVQDEYKHPSKGSTGGHVHAQTDAGAGGATGTGKYPKPDCCNK